MAAVGPDPRRGSRRSVGNPRRYTPTTRKEVIKVELDADEVIVGRGLDRDGRVCVALFVLAGDTRHAIKLPSGQMAHETIKDMLHETYRVEMERGRLLIASPR
jgi:hypothetical protein